MNGPTRISARKMTSTGNDLVFLPATRAEKTTLPRFYRRILTDAEQKLYCRHESLDLPFDQYVWLCWSIKESVYKYKKRQLPSLTFAPTRTGILDLTEPQGSEDFYRCSALFQPAGDTLYSRSLIRDGVIMTIVSEDPEFADTHWGCSPTGSARYADQSAAVRELALADLQTKLSRYDLRIAKDPDGCPILFAGPRLLDIPVSLAHHEKWVAWSYRYSPSIR